MEIIRMNFVRLSIDQINEWYSPDQKIEAGNVAIDSYLVAIAKVDETCYFVDFEQGTIKEYDLEQYYDVCLENNPAHKTISEQLGLPKRAVGRLMYDAAEDESDDDTEYNDIDEIDLIPYDWKDRPCCLIWRWSDINIKATAKGIFIDGIDVFSWVGDPKWDAGEESVISYIP